MDKTGFINILYILVFITLFRPYIVNHWDIIDFSTNVLRILVFLFLLTNWIIRCLQGYRPRMITILMIGMQSSILFSTIINHGNYYRWLLEMLSPITLVLFLEQYMTSISDLRGLINNWFYIIVTFLTLNIISILLGGYKNEGWLTDYFLGSKDTFNMVFALYAVIIYIQFLLFPNSKNLVIYCFINMLISILLTRSTTMLVEMMMVGGLWTFRKASFVNNLLDYRLILLFYLISGIVLLLPEFHELFFDFLDSNLDKGSGSVQARVTMWESGLLIFLQHPMWGIGKMTETMWNLNVIRIPFHYQLHNQFIEYLATGGLVLFSIYFMILISSGRNLMKYRHTSLGFFMIIIYFTLLIASLMTGIYSSEFYFVFVLAFYVRSFQKDIRRLLRLEVMRQIIVFKKKEK